MKEKIILSKIELEKLKELNKTHSGRKISKIMGYSLFFIQSQIKKLNYDELLKKNYPQIDGYHTVAICKKTNKEIIDYKNQSGAILNHILEIYPNISLESSYIRKNIEYKTGKFWYDDYFIFKNIKNIETFNCKLCDWSSYDINNKSGAYNKHLNNIHNISISDYILKYPEDKDFLNYKSNKEFIECKLCNNKYKSINNTHLKEKHNISLLDYKLKFGSNDLHSVKTKEKQLLQYNINLKNKPFINSSKLEELIIDNININFERSNRTILNGLEIDIVDHIRKIGIEINGCKFHTEVFGKKDRNYHKNKTLLSNKSDYSLIHIFEDEIVNNFDLIIKKLKHIFNINYSEKIFARKCEIVYNINSDDKSSFLNKNHIQGNDKSTHNIGAYYNGKLVSLMTFNNKRSFNKSKNHNNNIYELTRFCSDNNYHIIGIASKLFKNFVRKFKPKTVISFADIRWTLNSQNNLYIKLGFKLTKTLKPDYMYYNNKYDKYKRYHKFGFGKSQIKKKFPEVYDMNKTEWEMMQELGFDRIWDCGKFKYEINF